VEEAYGAVTNLPTAFSMLRTDILCDLDSSEQTSMRTENPQEGKQKEISSGVWVFVKKPNEPQELNKDDYFSGDLKGLVQRVTQELGGDRNITLKLLEKGFHVRYEPQAKAYTEAVDSIASVLIRQKRRNNSEFWNNILMFFNWRVWIRIRTIPVQLLVLSELINRYILPINAIIVTMVVWDNLIRWINETFYTSLYTSQIIFWWVAIQVVVMVSTKMATSDMFYTLCFFLTALLMMGSSYFFVNYVCIPIGFEFLYDPVANWPPFVLVIIFGIQHLVVSAFNPIVFFTGASAYIFFPTFTFTMQAYSFFNMDDLTWGTR